MQFVINAVRLTGGMTGCKEPCLGLSFMMQIGEEQNSMIVMMEEK